MTAIEPGEPITIHYGRDRQLVAHALTFREAQACAEIEDELSETEGSKRYGVMERMLRKSLARWTDEKFEELISGLNLEMVMYIYARVLGRLTEEDEKKSESPHSSDAANSAEPVAANATPVSVMN